MNVLNLPFFLLIQLFFCLSCSKTGQSQGEVDTLFKRSKDDWIISGNANWEFQEDELVGKLDSGAGFAISRTSYKNFELTLEFNPDSTINSGVFIRCKNHELSATNCYEINIWDLHPNQEYRTGAIVTRSKPLENVETLNQWNTYSITARNNQIQARINGRLTVDVELDEYEEGYIGLQAAEHGMVRFRNIQIKKLSAD